MYKEMLYTQPYRDWKVETKEKFYEKIRSIMIAFIDPNSLTICRIFLNIQATCYLFYIKVRRLNIDDIIHVEAMEILGNHFYMSKYYSIVTFF